MRLAALEGSKVVLWGAGLETLALSAWAARNSLDWDPLAIVVDAPLGTEGERALSRLAPLIEPAAAARELAAADLIARSPSVNPAREELAAARERGAQVTTPTGFWIGEHAGPRVSAVTGTSGKTTTTMLTAHLLRGQGRSVETAGNIGRPVLEIDDPAAAGEVVVELSSYQLADLPKAPPNVAIVNLRRDHLDWHGGVERYHADKLRLTGLPGAETVVADPASSPGVSAPAGGRLVTCGSEGRWQTGPGGPSIAGSGMLGEHNQHNYCVALTLAEQLGCEFEEAPSLAEFVPAPYRIETVAEAGGIAWICDSFSSSEDSVVAALETLPPQPLILIAGGRFRDQDFTAVAAAVLARGDCRVLAVEQCAEPIAAALRAAGGDAETFATLAEAIDHAAEIALPGSAVLMSPGAPPIDQRVPSYIRARAFTAAARMHAQENPNPAP